MLQDTFLTPYQGYCLQGFVLLAKINGMKSTWNFSSSLWTTGAPFAANAANAGLGSDQNEAKLAAFNNMRVTQLRLGMVAVNAPLSSAKWLSLPLGGKEYSSLGALMASGTYVSSNLGRTTWKNLVGPKASIQRYCNLEGLNVRNVPSPRKPLGDGKFMNVRIGLLANNEANCNTADTAIGFGFSMGSDVHTSCQKLVKYSAGSLPADGHMPSGSPGCSSDNGIVAAPMFGFILGSDAPLPSPPRG
jgi:hypothetical protein